MVSKYKCVAVVVPSSLFALTEANKKKYRKATKSRKVKVSLHDSDLLKSLIKMTMTTMMT